MSRTARPAGTPRPTTISRGPPLATSTETATWNLWVQSIGGHNVSVHVMVSNGDETFTIDTGRVTEEVLHNQPGEHWYFAGVRLVDVVLDGDLDVLQGQARDTSHETRNQFNIVLVNDGTGHFPSRIELPHADFYEGFTAVAAMTDFDVNGDELPDLILAHSRNDAIPEIPGRAVVHGAPRPGADRPRRTASSATRRRRGSRGRN